MGNAIWLTESQVLWFFQTMLIPFGDLILTTIPALGGYCLIVGVILAIRTRNGSIAAMAISPLLTHVLVFIAGLMRGQLSSGTSNTVILSFLVGQFALLVLLIWIFRRRVLQAVLFAVFGASYALFGGFLATMSFIDTWL